MNASVNRTMIRTDNALVIRFISYINKLNIEPTDMDNMNLVAFTVSSLYTIDLLYYSSLLLLIQW